MQKPLPLQFRVLRAVYRFQIEGVPGSVAKLKGPFTNEQIRHQGTDAFEPPPQQLPPRGFVTSVGVSRYLLGNYLHPEPTGDIAKEIRELVVLGFVKINSHKRDAQMLLPPLWVQREDGILILYWQFIEQNNLLTCVIEIDGMWAGMLENRIGQLTDHIAITGEGIRAYHEFSETAGDRRQHDPFETPKASRVIPGGKRRRGRRTGKLRSFASWLLDNDLVERHGRSWKAILATFNNDPRLPKNATNEKLRKAVEREEDARQGGHNSAPKK